MINFVQTQVYTVCSSKVCTVSLVYTKICKLNLNRVQTMINLIRMACAHSVNMVQTSFVQVPRQLHRRLHVHVVLQEAPAERGLVVGLPRLGLHGRLHPALRRLRRHGPAAAHSDVVVRPVRHRVRLLRAPPGPKIPVLERDAVRKHPLEGLQRAAAHGVEALDFQNRQVRGPVHVIRLQVLLDAPNDGPERVLDTVAQARLPGVEPLPLCIPQAVEHEDQGEQQLGHVVRVHDGLPPARTRCKRSVDQGYRMQI